MEVTQAIVTPPDIPTKWDIIPIHASDISAFKRCRRYWDWSSPTRTNLRRKVQIFGINFPLWFGSGIHYALEMYYNPLLQRDPVEAFITWYTYQWEGGVVTQDWLERLEDPNPVELADLNEELGNTSNEQTQRLYRVQGLRDLHPSPDTEEFETHRELGIEMMKFYRDTYAPKYDDFVVIAAESSFSVPLGFEREDRREDSPNYGKMLEAHFRGKRDMVQQSLETGQYGIMDHKTKAKIDDMYFESLNKDEQVTDYMWATQTEAIYYDLPYTTISNVIHQALRKAYPKPPTTLKNGWQPSVSRQEESTTAEMYAEHIKRHGIELWHEESVPSQNYYTWLLEKGMENFIVRTPVYRNAAELKNQGKHIRAIAQEMLDDPAIYPHPTGDFLCIKCQFRGPCIQADDGSDYQFTLNDSYHPNVGR